MPAPDRNPLANTYRLLIDGNNLLHAMSRSGGAAPPAALIGRLRAVVPGSVAIEIVFDGPPEPGIRGERIAAGTSVRYGRMVDGPGGTAGLLVVTDDRDLKYGARMRGARTAGSAWLLGRLDSGRVSRSSIGNPRPPRPIASTSAASQSDGDPAEMDRVGWRPGRGATTKRGNPKRAPRTGGAGRMRP